MSSGNKHNRTPFSISLAEGSSRKHTSVFILDRRLQRSRKLGVRLDNGFTYYVCMILFHLLIIFSYTTGNDHLAGISQPQNAAIQRFGNES